MSMRRTLAASLAILIGCASCSSGSNDHAVTTSTTTAPPRPPASAPSWVGRPEPCALLTDQMVTEVVGFDVASGPLAEDEGGDPNTCAWRNLDFGIEGGAVTVRVVEPGTDLDADRTQFEAVADVEGLGTLAFTGRAPGSLGPGITAIVVDVGDGGFGIVAATFEVRTPAEMIALARHVIDRWELAGGAPVEAATPPQTQP